MGASAARGAKKQEATRYVSPLDFARVYAQLGERDMAFTYIEAAFKDRSPGLVFLKVDPAWDKVRGESGSARPSVAWGCRDGSPTSAKCG